MATKLDGVHQTLATKLTRIYAAMECLGFPMRATEGVRTTARQQQLYAQDRTAPGPRVTDVDGVTVKSMHQLQADGYGHAVDSCFVGANPWVGPWDLFGEMVRAVGLKWGGDFGHKGSNKDRPHVELPLT